jgi:trimeric autotransporter adhesin
MMKHILAVFGLLALPACTAKLPGCPPNRARNGRTNHPTGTGINQTDAVNVGQLQSVAAGFQSQINNNDRRLRDGVAVALAAGGMPAVPYGHKVGVFGNVATYDGHGAAGIGLTGVLLDTRNYQVQGHGAVGVGFDTSVVGGRGGVAVFW